MPGPRPITASHRLNVTITPTGTRAHVLRMYLNAVEDSSDPDGADFVGIDSATVGMSTAIASLHPLLYALYPTTTFVGPYDLERYISGAYLSVHGDSSSHAGTQGSATFPAQQSSYTFRDSSGLRFRIQAMAEGFPYTGKYPYGALSAFSVDQLNFVNSCLNHASPHIGYWLKSRAGLFVLNFVSLVFDINKKLRREIGLA